MNNTNLIGRLTKKAELYQIPDKKTYARFTLAINRKKKAGGSGTEADFIPCIIWGKAAENLVSWTDKGTLISLEGELRTRSYDKDGQKHFVMEIWSTFFQVLSKPVTDN
ncbi:single-stranded DNA-binding protein [Streptococcus dysgalactiae]|uniref:single-stranded DNA-binding protein n=1 Tax=Streptococcus dysgalactiae TaxID=1334 RepID=UPI0013FE104D|nr:single-stranded DNA-binding protein [Streptococcus dysgalactiae]MCB2833569.1 single-stranded DNA-binding protein [Streptococcus dysgalactiae subsp. dysgalactiae]MCB2841329.1 single-stranded DNA-binding protein [Streptococcus dysgalactiae subsp. dysgalactiae]MCB2845714.1 single-stranded DNA-binding protein [Streptococcus dysgalactiae subsp. dysgalactiae]